MLCRTFNAIYLCIDERMKALEAVPQKLNVISSSFLQYGEFFIFCFSKWNASHAEICHNDGKNFFKPRTFYGAESMDVSFHHELSKRPRRLPQVRL